MTIMNERKVIKNTKFSLRPFSFNLNYSMNHEGCNCGLELLELNRTFVMKIKPIITLWVLTINVQQIPPSFQRTKLCFVDEKCCTIK